MGEPDSRVGTQFGPYRLDALLGRGGMGEVYRAFDTVRDREVAVKVLHERFAGDRTYEERFRRESQAVARLGEPHIIPIHDYGEIDGVLYLDMRLVEGEDLRARLRRTGPLSSRDAVGVIGQVAEALDAAHAAGLVHRDVKPENILVTASDFAYLVDFGIAHQAADTRLTQAGTAIGSLPYMAPELLDGVESGSATDVYSLTAVLFEALTGRPPFPGTTVSQIVRATVMNQVPSTRQFAPGVPPQLDAVVARGLAKDPAARFQSAGELAAAARAALDGRWPPGIEAPTAGLQTGPGAYDPTVIGAAPPMTAPMPPPGPSGPQYVGPAGHYPGPTGPQMYSEPRDDGRALHIVLGALIGLLVLALLGMGVYWFGFRDEAGTDSAAGPSSTTTLTTTVPATDSAATPPPGTRNCSSEVGVASSVTSCEFAYNVQSAYTAGGPKGQARTVVADSPVTGRSYTMSCTPENGVVVCRGGNNAVVVIF
ncbi:serine/threonine-protein kinase [Gordonia neofelifaecis]|uniref:non-specific serine/threonine protein kinase n=1 Tax=Gordonia neofelifaecis NRRL B-59395 TaxID=644548 RepID=F1YF29_9ACTN|nr:serine/threonine-protein kinase [Gordonia neofelifaecis]EGD56369.1 serine/threonine protein kinase-like protein [Gordonia neofelifaecis NRRL B-59395]